LSVRELRHEHTRREHGAYDVAPEPFENNRLFLSLDKNSTKTALT